MATKIVKTHRKYKYTWCFIMQPYVRKGDLDQLILAIGKKVPEAGADPNEEVEWMKMWPVQSITTYQSASHNFYLQVSFHFYHSQFWMSKHFDTQIRNSLVLRHIMPCSTFVTYCAFIYVIIHMLWLFVAYNACFLNFSVKMF